MFVPGLIEARIVACFSPPWFLWLFPVFVPGLIEARDARAHWTELRMSCSRCSYRASLKRATSRSISRPCRRCSRCSYRASLKRGNSCRADDGLSALFPVFVPGLIEASVAGA